MSINLFLHDLLGGMLNLNELWRILDFVYAIGVIF